LSPTIVSGDDMTTFCYLCGLFSLATSALAMSLPGVDEVIWRITGVAHKISWLEGSQQNYYLGMDRLTCFVFLSNSNAIAIVIKSFSSQDAEPGSLLIGILKKVIYDLERDRGR